MTNLDLFMKGEISLEIAQSAHVEIHNLRTQLAACEKSLKTATDSWNFEAKKCNEAESQLAKANERVKELEKENSEYAKCIISISERVDVQDFIKNNPTYENARAQLNKFAIEKKIEAISYMASSASDYLFNHDKLDIRANHLDMLLKNFCNYHINQLRKEQDSE